MARSGLAQFLILASLVTRCADQGSSANAFKHPGSGASALASSTLLFRDDFQVTSSTGLDDSWNTTGLWRTNDGAISRSAGATALEVPVTCSDCRVQIRMMPAPGDSFALLLRSQGTDRYELVLDASYVFHVVRVSGGVTTELAAGPSGITSTGSPHVAFDATGSGPVHLTVLVEGASILTVDDPVGLAAGQAGIRADESGMRFRYFLLYGSSASASPPPPAATGDWPFYRYDDTGASFVNTALSATQVSAAKPLWTYTNSGGIADTNPVVVGGVLYQVYYSNKLLALDAATGSLSWIATMGAPQATPCAPNFHNGAIGAAAVDGDQVFVPGGDGHVYAFGVSDGSTRWSTQIADNTKNEFLWASAFPLNGHVYVGVATFGGEEKCGPAAGRLVALDETTGAVTGTWWADAQHRGGGTIWTQPAYDAATGRLFVTTGNLGLGLTPADEPYAQAIVAIDPASMQTVDYFQVLSTSSTTDYDFGASPALVDTADGQHLIVAVNKNGYAYALDRNHLSNGVVWSYQISVPGTSPEMGQGSIVSPAAANGLVFVGGGETPDGHSGAVAALDAATGTQRWIFHPDGFVLAALSAAGDVVFVPTTGGSQGHVYALSQTDGSVLYQLDGSSFTSQLTFAEGLLFASDSTGNIHAIQPGEAPDAGMPDAGVPDAGMPDAGMPDAGMPDAGTMPVNFSDSFSECTSTADIGPNWTVDSGTWYCRSGKARGESAASIALADTGPMSNTDVTVRVQFASATAAGGVIARESGGSYYAARVLATGHVQAIRVDGSNETILRDAPESVQLEPSSCRVTLVVSGTSPATLTVSLSGTQVLSVPDTSSQSLLSGRAGLYNGADARTQFSGFSVTSF